MLNLIVSLALTTPAPDAAWILEAQRPGAEQSQEQKERPAGQGQGGGERPARERPAGERPADQTPPVERPVGERPANERGEERSRSGAGEAPPGQEGKERGVAGMSYQEIMKKMYDEEAKHREILAKLKRLRELAAEKKDAARVAEVDKLEQDEQARYRKVLDAGRAKLGDENFEKARQKLMEGRDRKGQAGGNEGGARETPERPAPGGQIGKENGRGQDKGQGQGERPGSQGGGQGGGRGNG
jgi:hypothetical protein